MDSRFKIIEEEPIKEEHEVKKPHNQAKNKSIIKDGDGSYIKLLGKVILYFNTKPFLV